MGKFPQPMLPRVRDAQTFLGRARGLRWLRCGAELLRSLQHRRVLGFAVFGLRFSSVGPWGVGLALWARLRFGPSM